MPSMQGFFSGAVNYLQNTRPREVNKQVLREKLLRAKPGDKQEELRTLLLNAGVTRSTIKDIYKDYLAASNIRWVANCFSATSSEDTRSLVFAISDQYFMDDFKYAGELAKYMCEEKNWNLGFCLYLWERYENKDEKFLLVPNEEPAAVENDLPVLRNNSR